jgi:hypothetical protein
VRDAPARQTLLNMSLHQLPLPFSDRKLQRARLFDWPQDPRVFGHRALLEEYLERKLSEPIARYAGSKSALGPRVSK